MVFVVPFLADSFVNATTEATKTVAIVAIKTIHQFAGVLLGEFQGQLFTIVWTILFSGAFAKLKLAPKWIAWPGYISLSVYLLAQAEQFATVIPGFPSWWGMTGFIGCTIWLL